MCGISLAAERFSGGRWVTEQKTSDSARHARFACLFAEAYPRLYSYLRAVLPHRDDAEEVLQETCIVLWQKFAEFEPESSFVAWACRIAHYKVLEFHRRETKHSLPLVEEFSEIVSQDTLGNSDVHEARHQALAGCLAKLKSEDRHIVQLRYSHDGSVKDTAQKVERSVDAVRKALQRIRRTLLQCIHRTLAMEGRV